MRQNTILKSLLVGSALVAGSSAQAATLTYDQNVTPDVIFGSGNANGSFTVQRESGVELGLRGKLRHNALGAPENTFNSNSDGTYSFAAGVAPTQTSPTAVWSFEWSINTDFADSSGWDLNDLTYQLGIDSDPSQGTSYSVFDPINVTFADHSIGDNSTGNGGGAEAADAAAYALLIANNNVAQNSWKAHWFLTSFDPTVDGTYSFYLKAYDGTTLAASTEMTVIVGAGGAAVPEAGSSIALLGLAVTGLGMFARRRNA